MRLIDLMDKNDIPANIDADMAILGLSCDSRTVFPGYLFAALAGGEVDGADYIPHAVERGARAVLTQREKVSGAACLHSTNPRRSLASIAARFFEFMPDMIVAVTGTNGKTSVTEFYRQIISGLGGQSASLGTLGITAQTNAPRAASGAAALNHTTPEPIVLHAALRDLYFSAVTHLALEASSHGLAQYRLDGVPIRAAAFTNMTRDHMDYHRDEADYFAAKKRLFTELLNDDGVAVVNLLGAGGDKMAQAAKEAGREVLCLGAAGSAEGSGADLELAHITPTHNGLNFDLTYQGVQKNIHLPVAGAFQAENFALAVGLCLVSGFDFAAITDMAAKLDAPKGRMECVGQIAGGAGIYVDYAHTPDALATALAALRAHTSGRLICVFGCGGDRDKGKRPQMGQAATKGADVVIVTDDNPRHEDAAKIRRDILAACKGAIEIADRQTAIAHAIESASGEDVILIAGKGHETGQIIGDKVLAFSDYDTVRSLLSSANGEGAA